MDAPARGELTAVLELPEKSGQRPRQRVLVTGAAGLVGEEVCRQLVARGWSVRALVRDAAGAALTFADVPVEICAADLRDVDRVSSALRGCHAVVHLAAIAVERGSDTYESVNTDATRTLLECSRRAGARRFVFMSQNGADPASPSRFLRSKGVAQQLVRESDLDWTVLRPSVIFGRKDEFVNVLARLARLTPFVLPLPDNGRARFQPIAVGDVARVVAFCLEREETVRAAFPLGGPAPLTLREIAERVLVAMRVRRAIIGIPRGALRPLVALLQRLLRHPPVTTSLLDLLGQDNVVPDNRLQEFEVQPTPFAPEELEYLRHLTFRDALRATFR